MDGQADAAAGRSRSLPRAFWVATGVVAVTLVWLARVRPSWPWFSLWVFALLALLGVLSLPAVRRALDLSWFGVTVLMLTGTAFFDLYLFQVETHRQRSERLEVRGVYFAPETEPIRVGVGRRDLDVRLEGALTEFDRWSVEVRRLDATRFTVVHPWEVDMLRVRAAKRWWPRAAGLTPALGARVGGGEPPMPTGDAGGGDDGEVRLLPRGLRGALAWGPGTAELSLDDPLLDRRLDVGLSRGITLAELHWDTLPDAGRAADLVLTRTGRGRALGRLRLRLPTYRLVSRAGGADRADTLGPVLAPGDTLWVTSRGKTWAFAVDLVPGVSRVAAPVAIDFVRRPRPSGWALPSSEACGSTADRCAVISTRPLPPPQPHFDLSGFGLDTARYAVLARLESRAEGVRIVGAHTAASIPYGTVHPLPALAQDRDAPDAGVLLAVSREAQGRQSAVLLTVLTLYLMVIGALVVLSGDVRLWARRKEEASPHVTAAWAFLNVFFLFLGIRLALGLRVAYTPPFYERAAATGVGLWITFAVMLVALGRWSAWTPRFWRMVGRVERPITGLFLPRTHEGDPPRTARAGGGGAGRSGSAAGVAVDPATRKRARLRTLAGLVVFLGSLGVVLWQRPESAAGLVVALVGLGAWLAMGIARPGSATSLSGAPMDVVTDHAGADRASASFAVAAGAAAVLVLAIHAPELALAPVLVLLALFAVNLVTGWTGWAGNAARRGWVLFAAALILISVGAYAFSPWPQWTLVGLGAVAAGLAVWLAGGGTGGTERRIVVRYRELTDFGRGIFSGVGWIGVLSVLGVLVFLDTQEIPPFVRFALVFMLFLLAIRAGLACHRALQGGTAPGGRMKARIEALGLLVIPLGVLLVFMLFDFGLGLVFFVPMFVTVLLAARIDRLPASLALGSLALVAGVGAVAWSVLEPSVADLRAAPDIPSFSREYQDVGNPLVDALRAAGLSGPITRATVRSMAASDPGLLEEALAFAGPSEALFAAAPSREQVWGGRAYAASGWTGTGFAGTTLLGRGVPTAVSYAENTFSVYVLSEHGALGGLAVLATYLALLAVVGVWVFRVRATVQDTAAGRAVLAMTVGGVLWLTIPAAYVAASNLGLVPLTGQNMPFLGLNSWADVVLVSGLATGIVLALATLDTPVVEGRPT